MSHDGLVSNRKTQLKTFSGLSGLKAVCKVACSTLHHTRHETSHRSVTQEADCLRQSGLALGRPSFLGKCWPAVLPYLSHGSRSRDNTTASLPIFDQAGYYQSIQIHTGLEICLSLGTSHIDSPSVQVFLWHPHDLCGSPA